MSKMEKLICLGGVPKPKRGEAATGLKVAKPKKMGKSNFLNF